MNPAKIRSRVTGASQRRLPHTLFATLLLAQPLVVQPYGVNRDMGSMVLVDPGSNRTVGAVMVTQVLPG